MSDEIAVLVFKQLLKSIGEVELEIDDEAVEFKNLCKEALAYVIKILDAEATV